MCLVVCEWGSSFFAYIMFLLVATRWQHMLESKLYSDGERAGESRSIFEMFFQGCVQKCKFGMESTTTVLSRNANLAVKWLRKGSVMSPGLFNIYMDGVVKEVYARGDGNGVNLVGMDGSCVRFCLLMTQR